MNRSDIISQVDFLYIDRAEGILRMLDGMSIHDARRLLEQCGTALDREVLYWQDSGGELPDPDTGSAETEPDVEGTEPDPPAPAGPPPRISRAERMFGPREEWRRADEAAGANPPARDSGIKGFVIMKCESCETVRVSFFKNRQTRETCRSCGHEISISYSAWRPVHAECSCGSKLTYRTNLQCAEFGLPCNRCGKQVPMVRNKSSTAYITLAQASEGADA